LSLLKKLAGETVIYGISNVASRMINFLLLPFYAHVMEQADFGIVNVMYGYVGLLLVIMTYRMETGFFRFGSEKGNLQRTFSTVMTSLFVTTPIFVFLLIYFSGDIASLIRHPENARYVIWFAIIIGMDTLTRVPMAKLRLDSRPMMFLLVQMTNIAINVGANLFFFLLCPWLKTKGYDWVDQIYDPSRIVDYVFISNLLASIVVFLLLLPEFFKVQRIFDKALFKKIFWYVLPLIPVAIAAIINETFDKPLLEWLLPGTKDEKLAEIGVYSANYKLAALITIIIQGFNYAAEPFFFRNKDRKDTKVLYGKVGQAFALLGSVAFLGLALYVDVAKVILGGKFATTEGMAVIPIVLMANLFLGLYYNFAIWYKLSDRTIMGLYVALVGSSITLLVNFIFVPEWGYIASAWATLGCYASMATLAYLLGQKYYPIHYPIKRMATYVLLAVGIYALNNWCLNMWGDAAAFKYSLATGLLLSFFTILYLWEKDHLIKEISGKTS